MRTRNPNGRRMGNGLLITAASQARSTSASYPRTGSQLGSRSPGPCRCGRLPALTASCGWHTCVSRQARAISARYARMERIWLNLTNSPADEHSAAWSPDGNWLAFVSNRSNDIDIYKVCATCSGEPVAVRLTDEVRYAMWPAWSPDGSQLAYANDPGGDLLLVNANRSNATYLTSGVFCPPIWRPERNDK